MDMKLGSTLSPAIDPQHVVITQPVKGSEKCGANGGN